MTQPLLSAATIGTLFLALAASTAGAADAPAMSPKDLASAKHCDVCHDTQMPKVGPPFREVARRYAGLNNAQGMLARIIRTGSGSPSAVFHWGSSQMQPDSVRVPVSDAEAAVLANYVLSFR